MRLKKDKKNEGYKKVDPNPDLYSNQDLQPISFGEPHKPSGFFHRRLTLKHKKKPAMATDVNFVGETTAKKTSLAHKVSGLFARNPVPKKPKAKKESLAKIKSSLKRLRG